MPHARKAFKAILAVLPIGIVITVTICAFAQGSDVSGSYEKQVSAGPTDPVIREFVRLVNAKRLAAGCPKLKWDDRIAAVAQGHSRDMVSRNFFGHANPDGKDPFERLRESNLPYSAAAEDLALGPRTGQEVYDTWRKSPEHQRNMLACRYTRHGVGRAENRWTHILLKP